MKRLETSPGASKERLRQRSYGKRARGERGRRATPAYAELHMASAFSFLDGASQPEDLVERAVELELPAVALVDRNGLYGSPRFHKAAKEAGLKAVVGAEVVIAHADDRVKASKSTRREASRRGAEGERLTLLV